MRVEASGRTRVVGSNGEDTRGAMALNSGNRGRKLRTMDVGCLKTSKRSEISEVIKVSKMPAKMTLPLGPVGIQKISEQST